MDKNRTGKGTLGKSYYQSSFRQELVSYTRNGNYKNSRSTKAKRMSNDGQVRDITQQGMKRINDLS